MKFPRFILKHKKILQNKAWADIYESFVVYLLDPTNAAKITAASRNVFLVKLRGIHAYHDDLEVLKKFKLNLAIASSAKTPSIK